VADLVPITFLYALGERVRWVERPGAAWWVIERFYRERVDRRIVRYRLTPYIDPQGTDMPSLEEAMAYEPDLSPLEDA
jgi:hypothetical protein